MVPDIPDNSYKFSKVLFEKAGSDPCVKIIAEEFQECMVRARDRLNLFGAGLSAHEVSEFSQKAREMISFCFGNPTARAMTGIARKPNSCNVFLRENFHEVDMELGICLHFLYHFLILVASNSPQQVSQLHNDKLCSCCEKYKRYWEDSQSGSVEHLDPSSPLLWLSSRYHLYLSRHERSLSLYDQLNP